MNKYRVSISGVGGWFVLGRVSTEAANYWLEKGSEELSEYVGSPLRDRIEPVEKKYRLPGWYKMSEFGKGYGISGLDKLVVENIRNGNILETEEKFVDRIDSIKFKELDESIDMDNIDGGIIFSRTFEKVWLDFIVNVDGDFKCDDLELVGEELWDIEFVSGVKYNGEKLWIEDKHSRAYASLESSITLD